MCSVRASSAAPCQSRRDSLRGTLNASAHVQDTSALTVITRGFIDDTILPTQLLDPKGQESFPFSSIKPLINSLAHGGSVCLLPGLGGGGARIIAGFYTNRNTSCASPLAAGFAPSKLRPGTSHAPFPLSRGFFFRGRGGSIWR